MPHEEEILRHPYQIKCWLRYIEHKSTAPKAVINLIYERALKQLPGRYKLSVYEIVLLHKIVAELPKKKSNYLFWSKLIDSIFDPRFLTKHDI